MSYRKKVTVYCDRGLLECQSAIEIMDTDSFLVARIEAERTGWRLPDGKNLCKVHAMEWWKINRGEVGMQTA